MKPSHLSIYLPADNAQKIRGPACALDSRAAAFLEVGKFALRLLRSSGGRANIHLVEINQEIRRTAHAPAAWQSSEPPETGWRLLYSSVRGLGGIVGWLERGGIRCLSAFAPTQVSRRLRAEPSSHDSSSLFLAKSLPG